MKKFYNLQAGFSDDENPPSLESITAIGNAGYQY